MFAALGGESTIVLGGTLRGKTSGMTITLVLRLIFGLEIRLVSERAVKH